MDILLAATRIQLIRFDVAVPQADAFNERRTILWVDSEHLAGRAFVRAGDDFDRVVFTNTLSHYSTSGAKLIILP